jgi:hypothetical protein
LTEAAPIAQKQPTPSVKPSSVVYWMRVVLAILAGLTSQLLHIDFANFGYLASVAGIGLGIMFYLISIVIVRYVLHYGEAELRGKNRYITLGGGTFIVVWIMVTVLSYTIGI